MTTVHAYVPCQNHVSGIHHNWSNNIYDSDMTYKSVMDELYLTMAIAIEKDNTLYHFVLQTHLV